MSTTLPLFWHLSSSSKDVRIEASTKLVGALEQFQAQFTPPSESSGGDDDEGEEMNAEQAVSNDPLDARNAPDVSYAIRRLVRGLASPRESSRLGFAVALTELLSRLDTVSASQALSLIVQSSQVQGSMKGQEERDMLFARLFGITSLAQSGILFRSTPLSSSSVPACTFQDFQDAMTMLLALPSQKSFLREPSYWTFILTLRALDASVVEWKEDGWTWVVQMVFSDERGWSPEKVGVALTLQCLDVKKDWKHLLAPTFKNGDILSAGSLAGLARTLMDVDIEDGDLGAAKSKGSSVWKPQVHWVWNLILDIFFPPAGAPPSKLKPKTSFPEFFRVTVDDTLLAPTASDGRKLWGFELFRLSLSRVPASDLPRLFTPNFMRSWVNHLSKPDRYLHKAAKLVASSLPPVITANPVAGFPLLLQLIQTHGHFDRLTRTKTVESMLAAMDVKGVQEYVGHLGDLAMCPGPKGPEDDPAATRIWVADQFTALIRNSAIPKTDVWVMDVLDFFMLHGIFGIRKINEKSKNRWLHLLPDPAFSGEIRAIFRARLLSSLADLQSQTITVKAGDGKTVRNTGVASNGESWISMVLHAVVGLERDTKHVSRLGLSSGLFISRREIALRDETLEIVGSLRNFSQDHKEATEGAELLLIATLLYRYLNPEHETDGDLEACIANVSQLFPRPDQKKGEERGEKTNDHENGGVSVEPIDALVDTLIGYLEKSTAYLRVIANQVFTRITELANKSTIDLIIVQLERRDPTKEEEEGENDDTPNPDDSKGDSPQLDSQSTNSDVSEDKSEDEDEDEDMEDDPELRKKIEDVLRTNGIQTATDGSDESSGSDSSEDLMDDDQMMRLDEHLANIFRSRAKERGRSDTGAQREATHFKNRVLDFADIFLRKQPTSKYVPFFLLPLVQILVSTGPDEKQLSDKVTAMLRSRIGKAKELPTVVDLPDAQNTLDQLHVLARKTRSADVRQTIGVCSLYMTRILLSEPVNDVKSVVDAYRASLADFATRKASPLQSIFIQDFVQRQPRAAWQFRDDFTRLSDEAVNAYRKCQTLQLLQPLLNQISVATVNQPEVEDFMRKIRQTVTTIISDACDDAGSLTVSQVKELLKLLLLATRQSNRLMETSRFQAVWDTTSMAELTSKLESSRYKSASLRGLCKQLHGLTGSNSDPPVVNEVERNDQKKRKAGETKDDGPVQKARRKKLKKNRD